MKRLALTIACLSSAFALPVAAQDGRAVYEANCAVCHEAGLDRAPDRTTLALMAPDRILYALERGLMVSMAVTLNTAQRRSVSEYLSGQSLADFTRAPPESAYCRDESAFRAGRPDWQGWGGSGLGNTRYQPRATAGLTAANVSRLDVRWAFAFPGDIRAYSPPTIAKRTRRLTRSGYQRTVTYGAPGTPTGTRYSPPPTPIAYSESSSQPSPVPNCAFATFVGKPPSTSSSGSPSGSPASSSITRYISELP